jgi:hypothetical protein
MKNLIKKLLRENLLIERLTNIESDVNLLYNLYFKNDIDEIERTNIVTRNMFKENQTTTRIFKDGECIIANQLKPCTILVNMGSNFYDPKKSLISIGIHKNALAHVLSNGGDFVKAVNDLSDYKQKKIFKIEFTEEKIKGSIHHELTHWIDDVFHNRHIEKRINKQVELQTRDIGGIPVNATKMEIQGQIHNIKQLYNKYKNNWDVLTFDDILNISPTLNTVNNSLPSNFKERWIRDLKIRMNREGLLGKNMR